MLKKIRAFLKKIKNDVINKILIIYYTNKGKRIARKYVVGKTYYNIMKNCGAIYRGNNVFYETRQVIDEKYGVVFYDSRNVTYTNLQIGLFNLWKQQDIEVQTEFGTELKNNPYKK